MDKKQTILAVDDTVANLKYLQTILQPDYHFKATPSGDLALHFLESTTPDLMLLDIKMPSMNGYELCKVIKSNAKLSHIPVIFISSYDDVNHKVEAFENGGVDYITKPFEPKEVLARIQTQIELSEQKKMINLLLDKQDLFIKKMMHEINTPSSIIALNCETLEKKLGFLDELQSIKAATKTLSSIYGDVAYLVKKTSKSYPLHSIDLVKLITQRIHFFDEMAKVKDQLIEFIATEKLTIRCNQHEFERIIDNTLSNAIKYSKPSTTITIELNQNTLLFKDQGVGMQNPQEVFESFYQDSTKNIGLGLGLSIVSDICKKYNIMIDVESEVNKGTTIIYQLDAIMENI
jgi:DNA-binding response OmpR family regulator/anti-sigma regulatory factor (Ser/Thr protein kinase)